MLPTTLTALATAYLFIALLVLAPRKVGYRHWRHTISEIGEAGARDQAFAAFGLFLPIGLALLAVAGWIHAQSEPTAMLALCIGVGYAGAAVFPCDPGSPWSGSPRQAMHNLAGAVEYIGGAFALLKLAKIWGSPFDAAGAFVLFAGLGLSLLPARFGRGALQRVAELCLFGALVAALWRLSR